MHRTRDSSRGRGGPPVVQRNTYRLVRILGEGGRGITYGGFDIVAGRPVAVKVPNDPADASFLEERKKMERVKHPNVVRLYAWGDDLLLAITDGSWQPPGILGKPYMVLELVDWECLDGLLGKRRLATSESVLVATQLCDALIATHDTGIIHRDVKPTNILLIMSAEDTIKTIKLSDFGIALEIGRSYADAEGTILGTPEYMAPEAFTPAIADPRADVYSVGVVLYELLAGDVPFTGANHHEIARKATHEAVSPITGIDANLHEVVMRALSKKPEHRQANMAELRENLVRVGISS